MWNESLELLCNENSQEVILISIVGVNSLYMHRSPPHPHLVYARIKSHLLYNKDYTQHDDPPTPPPILFRSTYFIRDY